MNEHETPAGAGSETPERKHDPDGLALRARPRPVTRINRRVLILLAGTGGLLLFGAVILALDPPRLAGGQGPESVREPAAGQALPEGLERLPARYDELPRAPIELGPPLPGNLGPSVMAAERELGLAAPEAPALPGELPFRPSPEDDLARAARIRGARLGAQASEAGLFYEIAARPQAAGAAGMQSGSAGTGEGEAPRAADELLLQAAAVSPRPEDPNLQRRKQDVLAAAADPATQNPHRLQDPASAYQLMAGSVIAASLLTGINSDLPGLVIAQVTENVHDTVTGRHLLIPQGARLIGSYDSLVAFGQRRALIIWERLILPDGSSVVIDNWPAADARGFAGLEDGVDFHTGRLATGIALSTLLGVGTEIGFGDDESDLVRAIRESSQQSASRAGDRIVERNLSVQPTITIRPGWPLRVIVHKDLTLRPWRG